MRIPQTQGTFLRQLRSALLWRLGPEATDEVMDDYSEFFAAGLAEGTPEAELCEQFGPPRKVARTLAQEESKQKSPPILVPMAGTAVLFALYCFIFVLWRYSPSRYLGIAVLFCVLCPIPMLFLLWRRYLPLPTMTAGGHRGLALLHLCSLLVWAGVLALCCHAFMVYVLDYTPPVPFLFSYLSPSNVGSWLLTAHHTGVYLEAAILICALMATWQRSAYFLTAAAHSLAALFSILTLIAYFTSMDLDLPITMRAMAGPALVVYLSGMISVLAVLGLLRWKRRRMHGRTA